MPATEPKSSQAGNLQVHVAESAEDLGRILRFRYDVVVDDIGLDGTDTDHRKRLVRDAQDRDARQVFLTYRDEIIASVRLLTGETARNRPNLEAQFGLEHFAEFPVKNTSFTDRLTVHRSWRSSQAPALLTAAAFKLARKAGSMFDFNYCAPGLVGLYEKLGYRRYYKNFIDPDYGLRVPLILVLDDLQYFRDLNSPFAALAQPFEQRPAPVTWFQKTFPHAVSPDVKALRDEQAFWEYLTSRTHQNPLDGVPLFKDMTYAEARRFLKSASILTLDAGSDLVREGDVSDEIYILLSGSAEVRLDERDTVLATLEKGSVIGEMAFLSATPRAATIRLLEDSEVLVLTQGVCREVLQHLPEIAAKVLLNLSLLLCERLRESNDNLANAA